MTGRGVRAGRVLVRPDGDTPGTVEGQAVPAAPDAGHAPQVGVAVDAAHET